MKSETIAERSDSLDEALNVIEAGARASGARPYLLDYLATAKANIFKKLANAAPTHEMLLRIWGAAAGIAEMERDLNETIAEGRQARQLLNQEAPGQEPGQAE